jgi:2-amino-4-hydroxy-6-hydroxymethyldihydropteridine diphosphokinase
MAYVSIYFSLGSNLGDRKSHIEEALRRMDDAFGCRYEALSRIIETKPWHMGGNDKFLNCCVLYRMHVPEGGVIDHCHEILHICKGIEASMGRNDSPEFDASGNRVYHNRVIDIDILFYGTERIDSEELTLPHPLIKDRPFVLFPLMEIAKPSLKSAFPEIFE